MLTTVDISRRGNNLLQLIRIFPPRGDQVMDQVCPTSPTGTNNTRFKYWYTSWYIIQIMYYRVVQHLNVVISSFVSLHDSNMTTPMTLQAIVYIDINY